MSERSVKYKDVPYWHNDSDRLMDMEMSVDQVIDGRTSCEWVGDASPAEVVAYLRKAGFNRKLQVDIDSRTTTGQYSSTIEVLIDHKDGRKVVLWMETDCALGRGVFVYDAVYYGHKNRQQR